MKFLYVISSVLLLSGVVVCVSQFRGVGLYLVILGLGSAFSLGMIFSEMLLGWKNSKSNPWGGPRMVPEDDSEPDEEKEATLSEEDVSRMSRKQWRVVRRT